MLRRIAITVGLIAILFGVYANHQLIKENEHDVRILNRDFKSLLGFAGSQIEINNIIFGRLNKTLDLSVLDSIGIITDGKGHGSCVAIEQNLIMTAKHCVVDTRNNQERDGLWVEICGRKYEILKSYVSNEYDVGFLRIKGRVKPLTLGKLPNVLDEIYIVGTPADGAFINNISKGIVGKIGMDWGHWKDVIVVDASAWWGNSGGPVFNKDGKIIGILVGSVPYSAGISVIEPISHIREALEDMGDAI